MPLAQVVVLLSGSGARPTSQAALDAARATLADLAGTEPQGDVRFVGYDSRLTPPGAPPGARVAVYQADYPERVTATTLANVSPVLRPPRVL